MISLKFIREAVKLVPQVRSHLSDKARFYMYETVAYKTYDYMLKQIEGLVRGVYSGSIGGAFIDTMANLISGQFTQAFEQAWKDEEGRGELPDYLASALESAILNQYDYVDQYYRDIVDARVDKTPIDPLLFRATLWAQRWTESYNEAIRLIALENGGNMIWTLGATEEHCPHCSFYNGKVMSAKEWSSLGIKPQNAPNPKLSGFAHGGKGCEGWQCDCSLTPTDKKRTPNAYGKIEEFLLSIG